MLPLSSIVRCSLDLFQMVSRFFQSTEPIPINNLQTRCTITQLLIKDTGLVYIFVSKLIINSNVIVDDQ